MTRSVLVLALIAALLGGCHSKSEKEEKASSILHLNMADDPASFDPRKVRSLKDLTIAKQLFEGLMRLDEEGIPQPALATSCDISDDLLTYTFHLRASKWSNGEPLTAYDFERSWKEALDPSFGSDYAYMLFAIKGARARKEIGVRATDESTLAVTLERATPYFLELTAFPTYSPVHKEGGVSNGPFCLAEWKPQEKLLLAKNPAYWDASAVHLDLIAFSIVPDNNTEAYLFEKGELDWLGQPLMSSVATDLIAHLKQDNALKSYPVAGTFWLKFNTEMAPFNNAKLRRAFSYAVHRQKLITHILQGSQSPATSPLPPSMALRATPHFEDGNTRGARALFEVGLAEGDWTRGTLPRITLSYSKSERNEKIVQQIQQEWEHAFGIKVHLVGMENQVYRKKARAGEFQVGTGDWIGDFNDPIAFLELFEKNKEMNDTRWSHARYSELLALSAIEKDPDARKTLLQEAENLLIEAMPIIPLYHYAFDYAKKEHVTGTLLSPLGIADFKKTQTTPLLFSRK